MGVLQAITKVTGRARAFVRQDIQKLVLKELMAGRKHSSFVKVLDSRPHIVPISFEVLQNPVLRRLKQDDPQIIDNAINIIKSSLAPKRGSAIKGIGGVFKLHEYTNVKITKDPSNHILTISDILSLPTPVHIYDASGATLEAVMFSSFSTAQEAIARIKRQLSSNIDTKRLQYRNILDSTTLESYETAVRPSGKLVKLEAGFDAGHVLSKYSKSPLSIQLYAVNALFKSITESPGSDIFNEAEFKELLEKEIGLVMGVGVSQNIDQKTIDKEIEKFITDIRVKFNALQTLEADGIAKLQQIQNSIQTEVNNLEKLHEYGATVETWMEKTFGESASDISLHINVVLLQDSLENQHYWGTGVEGVLRTSLLKIINTLKETEFSDTLIDSVTNNIIGKITGIPHKKTRSNTPKERNTVDDAPRVMGAISIGKKKSTGISGFPNIKRPNSSQRAIKVKAPTLTNLTALQIALNQALPQQIRQNMGTGTDTRVLNNQTGRFSETVKVERLSESRQGMITAFYSYMKYPYATFSDGGAQQYPKSRDPKLLISKSIREIASTVVGNRMRAVSV